jgi:hypothetical protein
MGEDTVRELLVVLAFFAFCLLGGVLADRTEARVKARYGRKR